MQNSKMALFANALERITINAQLIGRQPDSPKILLKISVIAAA
jgi:hypothetical protein